MKKKKKSKKFLVRKIVALFILIAIIFSIKNLKGNLLRKEKNDEISVLIDNSYINLTDHVYIEDSVIYISEEDVKQIFDPTIYYNIGDKELITSNNNHVAVMHFESNEMMINDSTSQSQGKLKEIDSKLYIPITDLQIVYDIEIEYAEETNTVIIDSTKKSKKQVIVLDDTTIKSSNNMFSNTIENAKRGDYLYVIEDCNKYRKVRTSLRKDWIRKK